MALRFVLLLLGALGGCTPDFDPVSLVKDLRILGIQADPPEVLVPLGSTSFPPVRVRALVADPQAPESGPFDWQLWACTADDVYCAGASQQQLVARGRGPASGIEADFVLDLGLAAAALQTDEAKGFGGVAVMVELQVYRGPFTDRAIKRLVYGYPLPPQKTPNANPALGRLLVDDQELPSGQPIEVTAGQEVKILPAPRADAAESYWVLTFTGGTRQLTEFLSYSFFTTSGSLSDAITGGKPSAFVENKKIADPSSTWKAPASPGQADLWVLVRDDRGGMSWTRLKATVR